MLRFNFSAFNDAPETLERNFENYCHLQLLYTLEACPESFPESVVHRICSQATINDKLNALFLHSGRAQIPLYVLIDEYDNFANTILAYQGADAYHAFTHGGGFYRNFFATLKAGTENGSVARLFVTGVSRSSGRRHQRLQHRRQPQPPPRVQRTARLHRSRSAGPAFDLPGPGRLRPGP